MKTLIVILAMGFGLSTTQAQKVKSADVPAAVKEGFQKQYPAVKSAGWEKENGNFEAEFEVNEVETSALFDASGKMLETETEIAVSALPKAVSDYISKNLSGKKIKEASKIVDAAGKVTFEAEVDKADYVFDADGAFIRKDVD